MSQKQRKEQKIEKIKSVSVKMVHNFSRFLYIVYTITVKREFNGFYL